MTETRNSSVKQKPHIPTISRMKKPPVSRGPAHEPSRLPGNLPASGRGVYGDSVCAGPISTHTLCEEGDSKEHRRFADALDNIILPHLFGSKVQFSDQSKIFCYLPDKIPMPLLCCPLRYAEL